MNILRRHLLLGGAAALALSGCDRGSGPAGAPTRANFNAIDITGADYAKQIELPDADGRARTLADFRGKVTVVFFGFTHCPDVCPGTMAELAEIKRSLGADGARLQGVFITLDPERDTPELLKNYVAAFDPSFVALRGTPEQTQATAKHFRIFYAKSPGKTPDSYGIDHTAGSFVFDGEGRVRLFSRYGAGPQALTSDLKQLLSESA